MNFGFVITRKAAQNFTHLWGSKKRSKKTFLLARKSCQTPVFLGDNQHSSTTTISFVEIVVEDSDF